MILLSVLVLLGSRSRSGFLLIELGHDFLVLTVEISGDLLHDIGNFAAFCVLLSGIEALNEID